MATTISRPTITDDSGTPAAPVGDGTLFDAAFWSDIFDKIDAMFTGATFNASGLLDMDGFGSHQIAAGGTGGNILHVRNTSAGTGNFAQLQLGNDGSDAAGVVAALSSTFTSSAVNKADGISVAGKLAGGLSVAAEHASGDLRLYARGSANQTTYNGDTFEVDGATVGTYGLRGMVNGMVNVTTVGTDADTTEKDLHTNTLPASALAVDGQMVELTAMLQGASNANTKTIRVYLGTTVILNTAADFTSTYNGLDILIRVRIIRTGSSAQRIIAEYTNPQASGEPRNHEVKYATAAEDLTTALDLKITGQNGTASANDIQALVSMVDFVP